jgi:hypothetical protein
MRPSPVCRYESVRLLLALAATKGLAIKVKTAFLNGELEEIFMAQPEGFDNRNFDEVCLLKKRLYGLKQAPRCWNRSFSKFITGLRFIAAASDPSVFITHCNKEPIYLFLYVDDGLLISYNKGTMSNILTAMQKEFDVKTTELTQFLGIGINYDRKRSEIFLCQTKAIHDMLIKFNMSECKPASVPMPPNLGLLPYEECNTTLPDRE